MQPLNVISVCLSCAVFTAHGKFLKKILTTLRVVPPTLGGVG